MNYIRLSPTTKIYVDFREQIDEDSGRLCRLSGIAKNLQIAPMWIGKIEKYCWIYRYIYLDEKGGFFNINIDHNDKYVKQ